MPKRWELVASLAGTVSAADASAPLAAVDRALGTEHAYAHVPGTAQTHREGIDCSLIKLRAPRELRVLELRLCEPQPQGERAERYGYAIRQLQVIGPGPAHAEQSAAQAANRSRSDLEQLLHNASKTVAAVKVGVSQVELVSSQSSLALRSTPSSEVIEVDAVNVVVRRER